LKLGASGTDVLKLQRFLNTDTTTAIPGTGDGSAGKETGYFGNLTKAAVLRFQEKYASEILVPNKLAKGNGFVGASTRAKLNALCGAILGATTEASSSSNMLTLTVPEQPPHILVPANALYVPFTKVTFTAGDADVTVSRMLIERVGPGRDSAFYDVGVLDPDGVEFAWGYLNALHQVTIREPFTVPAHESKTYTIVGDMNIDLSGNEGEMPILQLNSIEASAPVVGPFPIAGTPQSINGTIVIGSASAVLAADDPHDARTRYVNDTNIVFSGIRITAGSQEDLRLTSVYWEQSGSAGVSDIANVVTIAGGTSYPTENDGRHYLAVFPDDGILLKKGESIDVIVKGDITGSGSGRTVQFDLHYGADVGFTGTHYGFGVNLLAGGNTATSGNGAFLTDTGGTDGTALVPFFAGTVTTISGGAMTSAGKN
jgi:hypothetical protein